MKTINKELTHSNLLILKDKLQKDFADVFKQAQQIESAIICLSTLPTGKPQSEHDVSFVENRFADTGLIQSLVKE